MDYSLPVSPILKQRTQMHFTDDPANVSAKTGFFINGTIYAEAIEVESKATKRMNGRP